MKRNKTGSVIFWVLVVSLTLMLLCCPNFILAKQDNVVSNVFYKIAGGGTHSLALSKNGQIWAWGYNYFGQLGNGEFGRDKGATVPLGVKIAKVIDIAGGGNHSAAVKSDGTVWTWGANYFGKFGDAVSTPVQVRGLSTVKSIACGDSHYLALKKDGSVWAWGINEQGQLGNNTFKSSQTPVKVAGLSNIIAIAGGTYHSLALKSDGTVWAWGDNTGGQLGDGSMVTRNKPVQVAGLKGVVAISGGILHSLALRYDGTVWAWGSNAWKQLGNDSILSKTQPVQVPGLTNIIAIAAGGFHNIALKADRTIWTWGNNNEGELGDGTAANQGKSSNDTTTCKATPVQIPRLTGIEAIAAGGNHALAIKTDGTIWAWGDNYSGQIGDGTLIERNTPVQVNLKNIK